MRRTLVTLSVILCITTRASAAYAHHSHPYFYDECKSITIEGRVERVEFKDPHTSIVLILDDGSVFIVDWAPRSRLTSQGVIGPAKEALVFGARIVVTGNRIRPEGQIREHFPDFTTAVNPNTVDPSLIRRVDQAFTWELPTRATPLTANVASIGARWRRTCGRGFRSFNRRRTVASQDLPRSAAHPFYATESDS
jgi:hypothetical protein